jgi:hypothetical protein
MPNALIPHEIDRGGARSWVSNPALKMITQSSLLWQLKYLPMILLYSLSPHRVRSQRAEMCQEGINYRHYLPKADLLFFMTRHYELNVMMWYINLGFKAWTIRIWIVDNHA